MFDKVSRDKKHDALILSAKGIKTADVAVALQMSELTIRRAKARQQKHGDVEGGQKKRGPKGALPLGNQDVCLSVYITLSADPIRGFWQWFLPFWMQTWRNMRTGFMSSSIFKSQKASLVDFWRERKSLGKR